MKKFKLEMLTPEREFYNGEAESLIVTSPDGDIGILASHTPIVIGLNPSTIEIRNGDDVKILSNGEGFLEVTPDKTIILCQTMEWPEEIELNRVNRAIEEHERKAREAKSVAEYKMSKATLARAFARLKAVKK